MDYFVCGCKGNDENVGTKENPFKTIDAASKIAGPGDTINVESGIYRERIAPVQGGKRDKPLTYKSIEKHGVIIRGSNIWKPDIIENNIAKGMIEDSFFPDKSHKNGGNPFEIKLCVTPYGREGFPETKIKSIKKSDPNMHYCLGQVFVNDVMYKQCPYKNEMETTNNSWYYESETKRLFINGVSDEDTIEITNQRRLFAPHKRNLRNINIDGFIFERCGNQYPNRFWVIPDQAQAGAVGTRSGKFWKITNNIIRYANGIGIDWGNEGKKSQDLEIGKNGDAFGTYGHIISNNIISNNGAAGTAAFMANKFIFEKNIVEYNNNLHFKGKQRWESGGLKTHRPNNSIVRHNIIRNNYCHGLWSDQGAGKNCLIEKNYFINNGGSGCEFEIGVNMSSRVVNNIFYDNKYGVRFSTSGGVLVAHNLFLKSSECDIETHIFKRGDKWDSKNVNIYYNTFVNAPEYIHINSPNKNPQTLCSRFFNYNTYVMDPIDKKFHIKKSWKDKCNYNYKEWQEKMKYYNEENADEHSMTILKYEDVSGMIYELCENPVEIPNYAIEKDKIGSLYDFNNKKWNESNHISGPFLK